MNVSRETSFADLLGTVSCRLNLNQIDFGGLTGSAAGLILLSVLNKTNRHAIAMFGSKADAEDMYRLCYNLLPEKVMFYPEQASDELSIPGFGLEIERYRSEAVNAIQTQKSILIITTHNAAEELSVDGQSDKKEQHFSLKPGDSCERQLLVDALNNWGYEHADHTINPKSFSTRGGILDVFLPYTVHPIRLEFFGNEIESIREFNPRSQRTIKSIDEIDIQPPPENQNSKEERVSLMEYAGEETITINIENLSGSVRLYSGEKTNNSTNLSCKDFTALPNETAEREEPLLSIINEFKGKETFLFIEDDTIHNKIIEILPAQFKIIGGVLESGFYSKEIGLCCLSLAELNRQSPVLRSRWTPETATEIPQRAFSALEDLCWGDHLVHQDFGIGVYRGLQTIKTHNETEQECIRIEYAGNSSVFVPVDKFNRVHKLIATGDKNPVISSLGGTKWARQKQHVKDSAQEVVKGLIAHYTARSRKRGFSYNKNNGFMQALENSFPYQETLDQHTAIEAVARDMESELPLDRLICGDVGFGKTEVALRASLKAITSSKKVLFLTPTTILADQHYISTKARLEPLGVNVALLSRFRTKHQQQEILEQMHTGTVDLVIGTHRLLSADIQFPDLGLLIIDEEHRFGVRHKEKLRQLRATVDVLTLTATPIPRTLQQSLLGVRDISRINTAPKARKPIKTFVQYFNWKKVKSIINNELVRNGQVYYLHNDVASILFIFNKLKELFPLSVVGVAHGQMKSRQLEKTVLDFFDGQIDILLCTTIIESGLDVSNANTIVINNAQNFGLAQLYQIRGRVGRSHRQAYCYLMLPAGKTIGKKAVQRLKAIEQFTSLGSGYNISLKDLEIRGAGNLFGYKQSGHIAAVGFEMYCKLLQEAVDESTGKSAEIIPPKISISVPALLEDSYVQLVQDRLYFYQRLSEATTVSEVNDTEIELRDRFGKLPEPATNLIYTAKLRAQFIGTEVSSLSVLGDELRLSLTGTAPFVSAKELIDAVSTALTTHNYKFKFIPSGESGFEIRLNTENHQSVRAAIDLFVQLLTE